MLDFSQRRELSLHAEVAADVTSAFDALKISGVVVGAFARDLHLHYGAGIPVQRGTEDIDFAFAIAGWNEFHALRKLLLGSGAFREIEGKQHQLRHHNSIPVDLVPFGSIETDERSIAWPPTGDVVMNVFGFQESVGAVEEVLLPGGVKISIVCLQALALLKIIAWENRHLQFPGRDAADLNLIIRNYLMIEDNKDRLWSDDFIGWTQLPGFDYEHAGAQMLGHDMRRLVDQSGLDKIGEILRVQLNDGVLPQEMDRRSSEKMRALLKSLYDEFNI